MICDKVDCDKKVEFEVKCGIPTRFTLYFCKECYKRTVLDIKNTFGINYIVKRIGEIDKEKVVFT